MESSSCQVAGTPQLSDQLSRVVRMLLLNCGATTMSPP